MTNTILEQLENNAKEIVLKRQDKLDDFVKKNENITSTARNVGIILALAGIIAIVVAVVIYKCMYSCSDGYCEHPCGMVIYITGAVALLVEVAAIMCFATVKSSNQSANKYRDEQIQLRNLLMALEVVDTLSDETIRDIPGTKIVEAKEKKDADGSSIQKETTSITITTKEAERTNARKQIIETLLNRCNS